MIQKRNNNVLPFSLFHFRKLRLVKPFYQPIYDGVGIVFGTFDVLHIASIYESDRIKRHNRNSQPERKREAESIFFFIGKDSSNDNNESNVLIFVCAIVFWMLQSGCQMTYEKLILIIKNEAKIFYSLSGNKLKTINISDEMKLLFRTVNTTRQY